MQKKITLLTLITALCMPGICVIAMENKTKKTVDPLEALLRRLKKENAETTDAQREAEEKKVAARSAYFLEKRSALTSSLVWSRIIREKQGE